MILQLLCVISLALMLGFIALADIYRHDPVRGRHIISTLAGAIANVLFFPIAVGYRLFFLAFHAYATMIFWEYISSRDRLHQLYRWGCKHFPDFAEYMGDWEKNRT